MASGYAVTSGHEHQVSDDHVVDAVRQGDVAAFDVLAERYYGQLTRHLAYRLADQDLAADLAQDVFLDAFRRLDRFDGDRPFVAWLYGIAHKRLLMHWRRNRIRRLISLDWLASGSATGAAQALLHDDNSESCLEQDALAAVFAALSPSLSEALLLHSLDGFTAPEIAGILGISRAAAKRRVSRAKEQFRKIYQDQNHDT